MIRTLVLGLLALGLAACGGMKVEDFAGKTPALTLEGYFAGKSRAWGIFEDRFGRLRRQFVVDIEGSWDAARQELTLVEDFVYDDGETERRVWIIRKTAPASYEGTADGVVGKATGRAAGNAFYWTYLFDLKVGEGTWQVRFDDWMWLQDAEILINRAEITKWGFQLGTVSIFFRRLGS
ncbi:MAG: DUF3833 domain-containing protein [Alphaproteobacteria bacterium]|nr:DUF3833 domain-containing protein [Alphaproteobacteria bacterium]